MEKLLDYLKLVPPVVKSFFALLTKPGQFLVDATVPSDKSWTNALLYYAAANCVVTFWIVEQASIYVFLLEICGGFFVVVTVAVFVVLSWRLVARQISMAQAAVWALYAFSTFALISTPFFAISLAITNSIEELTSPGHPTGILRKHDIVFAPNSTGHLILIVLSATAGYGLAVVWLFTGWGALRTITSSRKTRSFVSLLIFLILVAGCLMIYGYWFTSFYPQIIRLPP